VLRNWGATKYQTRMVARWILKLCYIRSNFAPEVEQMLEPQRSPRKSAKAAKRGLVLVELFVFGFSSDKNGSVRVGAFPDGKEILVRSSCSSLVAFEHIGPAEIQVR
jgi:hypothetical protein